MILVCDVILCVCEYVPSADMAAWVRRSSDASVSEGWRAGEKNSAVAPMCLCASPTLCWTAGALAGWLSARAQPGWFRASRAPRLASWSYPLDRIGYPNSDSQSSLASRFLSVLLPRPDSALSSSANHDSYRHTHWSTMPAQYKL